MQPSIHMRNQKHLNAAWLGTRSIRKYFSYEYGFQLSSSNRHLLSNYYLIVHALGYLNFTKKETFSSAHPHRLKHKYHLLSLQFIVSIMLFHKNSHCNCFPPWHTVKYLWPNIKCNIPSSLHYNSWQLWIIISN